jgi:hypothetical protein
MSAVYLDPPDASRFYSITLGFYEERRLVSAAAEARSVAERLDTSNPNIHGYLNGGSS